MKIIFVADGRSDHIRRWIAHFINSSKHDVILVSTYPCAPIGGVKLHILEGLFRLSKSSSTKGGPKKQSKKANPSLLPTLARFSPLYALWNNLKLIDAYFQAKILNQIIRHYSPDLLHAFRIQNEGYLTINSDSKKTIISSWGQDFIQFADKYLIQRILTQKLMRQTRYFFADCQRDIDLAKNNGLPSHAKTRVYPGNGGVDMRIFHANLSTPRQYDVLYCRGLTNYTRIEVLFKALRYFYEHKGYWLKMLIIVPAVFNSYLKKLIKKYDVFEETVTFEDTAEKEKLAQYMRSAKLFVSPTISDGIPNSMLEAMSCGMLPIVGDVDSIREVISHGMNGLIFKTESALELCEALSKGLELDFEKIAAINHEIIKTKYEYEACMVDVEKFYESILETHE